MSLLLDVFRLSYLDNIPVFATFNYSIKTLHNF